MSEKNRIRAYTAKGRTARRKKMKNVWLRLLSANKVSQQREKNKENVDTNRVYDTASPSFDFVYFLFLDSQATISLVFVLRFLFLSASWMAFR